jgi:hypothetical protein
MKTRIRSPRTHRRATASGAWRLAATLTAAFVAACGGGSSEPAGAPGLIAEDLLQERRLDYLRFATERLDPGSPMSVVAHLERARIDPGFTVEPGVVPSDAWDARLEKMAALEDTRDFDALQLLNVVLGYRDEPALAPGLVPKVEAALRSFKLWYTEPTPDGLIDDSYYWTENHQVLFHTLEYLIGQTWPDEPLSTDGRSGREHRVTARERLLRWFDLRSRFGFGEWHSNVYYQEDVNALLTLAEYADEEDIAVRAEQLLDVLFFDIAMHTQRDAFGVTHGRSYKKDKMTSLDDDTWNGVKLLFDRSEYPYQSMAAEDAVLISRAKRYRLPEVIRRIARSPEAFVDRERIGIPIDEDGPFVDDPEAPYGFSYTDPADLGIWWGMGALTAWPVVPLTLATFEEYDLWETTNFRPFAGLRALTADPRVAQQFAVGVSRFLNFGVLNEVNTYTHRTADYLLSSAVDYRKGSFAAQVHTWQATLDANALVFTNHPFRPLPETLDWSDRNLEQGGYWTGEASIPRAAQHENVGVYLYAPQWQQTNGPPLDYFRWQPFTHAYFPQDHFDEVVQEGSWTFGRKGDGYVALYSWRPTRFLVYDPTRFATNGMTLPFDLVAEGGADNVWLVECGRAADWGSFAAFRAAIATASVSVTSLGPTQPNGIAAGFDVAYESPSQGRVVFGWEAPFVVDGVEQPLSNFPRFDNPFSGVVEHGAIEMDIAYEGYGLHLDFAVPSREASAPAD